MVYLLQLYCSVHCKEINTENSKQILPEKEWRGLSPDLHIHVSLTYLYIPRIRLPILLQENMWT
jgi:hypothetical protein